MNRWRRAPMLLLAVILTTASALAQEEPLERISDAEFQALVDKTNLYVRALNATTTVRRSFERYDSWVDVKKGVTGRERYISYGLYELGKSSVDEIRRAGQRGPQMRPALPVLDDAAVELANAVTALEPLVRKAYEYYRQENYRDDNAAAGQQLHKEMMPLFERVFAAETALREGVDALKEQLDRRQLEELERVSGRNYQWHLRSFMLAAKGVINLLPDGPTASPIPAKEYRTRFAELEKTYDALRSYISDNPAEAKKLQLGSMVESAAGDFFTASKLLQRTLSAERLDRREYVERLTKVAQSYNHLIQLTNTAR
jgi:hypothetical protein